MESVIAGLLKDFEDGRMTRRQWSARLLGPFGKRHDRPGPREWQNRVSQAHAGRTPFTSGAFRRTAPAGLLGRGRTARRSGPV